LATINKFSTLAFLDGRFVNVTGDQMTGNLDMQANNILITGDIATNIARCANGYFTNVFATTLYVDANSPGNLIIGDGTDQDWNIKFDASTQDGYLEYLHAGGGSFKVSDGTNTIPFEASDVTLTDFDSGNKSIADILNNTVNCGVLDIITVTDEGGLNISWTSGEIWDCVGLATITIDAAGSTACTDNNVNYLYWDRSGGGTALTLSTTEWDRDDDDVPVAIIICQNSDVWGINTKYPLNEREHAIDTAMNDVLKVVVVSGLMVSEDADATNDLDVQISAGTFYHFGSERHDLAAGFNTRTIAMKRWYHSGGAWTTDTNAEIDPTQYDNLTDLTAVSANKYYKSIFMYSDNTIHWIYPQAEYNTRALAIAAPLPTIPVVGEHFPRSVAVVMKGSDTTFPTAGGERWIDIRPMFGTSIIGNVTDHSSLSNLNWSAAGHIMDATLDMNSNAITEVASIDTLEVFNSGGDLKIQPDVQGDVVHFGDTDVADAADGKSVYVKRMAEEGDTTIQLYINQYRNTSFDVNFGNFRIYPSAAGNLEIFSDATSGENPYFKQFGYITAVGSKYIQWQVNDTTDNFELTREDANIGSFDIQMPLITDAITASGTLGCGAITSTGNLNVQGAGDSFFNGNVGFNNVTNAIASVHAGEDFDTSFTFDFATRHHEAAIIVASGTRYNLSLVNQIATNSGPTLSFLKSNVANAVVSGNTLGNITWAGWDGDAYVRGAQIKVSTDGTPGNEDMPTKLEIYTTPDGSKVPALAMTINSDKSIDMESTLDCGAITTPRIDFTDNATYIDRASGDGWLNIHADIGIEMNAPTWAMGELITAGEAIFNSSSLDVDFTVNWNTGTGLFVQGSDGFVGIGTATPLYALQVAGPSGGVAEVHIGCAAQGDTRLFLQERTSDNTYGISWEYMGDENTWAFRRHDNLDAGTIVFSGTRGSNNVTFTGDVGCRDISCIDITPSGNVIFNNDAGDYVLRGTYVKSLVINHDTSGLGQIVAVAVDGDIVKNVWVEVTETWDGNGTVTVGDEDDNDGYLTWFDMGSGSSVGYYGVSGIAGRGAYLDAAGEVRAYDDAGIISAYVTEGTSTKGSMIVYVEMTRVK